MVITLDRRRRISHVPSRQSRGGIVVVLGAALLIVVGLPLGGRVLAEPLERALVLRIAGQGVVKVLVPDESDTSERVL